MENNSCDRYNQSIDKLCIKEDKIEFEQNIGEQ